MRRVRARQADASRLRGAIGNVIDDTKSTAHALDSQLRAALHGKIRSTEKLSRELDAELSGVLGETAAADTRRAELEAALAEKLGPLALGRQRYQMRHARPAREKVHDEVEDALSSEFNDLRFVSVQLERKIAAVTGESSRLHAHAVVLRANIKDKTEALAADRAVLALDDRDDAMSMVSSVYQHSVVSAGGSAVGSRVGAVERIAALETELEAARAGRMMMESELRAATDGR
jgi:hypothetical protein